MTIDHDYIESMQMTILEGRGFEAYSKADSAGSIMINQELAKILDWEDPVGKTIELNMGQNQRAPFIVIGVIRDFNFATVQHPIEPLYFRYGKNNGNLAIKLNSPNPAELITKIEEEWKQVYPENVFEYDYLDDQFKTLYDNDKAFASMFNHLTFLAIFIAIIGLFGLSAFAAEQRSKELGIRKVLGARIDQIVFLLSKEFIVLVGVAFIISVPVAWFSMNKWLDGFVYKIEIGFQVFIFSAIIAIFVALITVSWQSIKAALTNPAISLRDE